MDLFGVIILYLKHKIWSVKKLPITKILTVKLSEKPLTETEDFESESSKCQNDTESHNISDLTKAELSQNTQSIKTFEIESKDKSPTALFFVIKSR